MYVYHTLFKILLYNVSVVLHNSRTDSLVTPSVVLVLAKTLKMVKPTHTPKIKTIITDLEMPHF